MLEGKWIQPSINQLDLSFFTQKIIDNVYSVIDENISSTDNLAQSWFWEDKWQAGEQKVDNYIREGKIEEFDTIEDFVKSLRE